MVGCEILVWNIGIFIGTRIHTYRSTVDNYFIPLSCACRVPIARSARSTSTTTPTREPFAVTARAITAVLPRRCAPSCATAPRGLRIGWCCPSSGWMCSAWIPCSGTGTHCVRNAPTIRGATLTTRSCSFAWGLSGAHGKTGGSIPRGRGFSCSATHGASSRSSRSISSTVVRSSRTVDGLSLIHI